MFLRGSFTALATPFTPHGIDEKAFASFVEWQIGAGTQGLVPCGTTGEGPTLTAAERDRLIRVCVERAAGCVPVIAGTGTNCTATTIEATRAARSAGADAALIVTPYYNRPTQEGLYRHYAAVASAVDLPIILYNVPTRTGVDLHVGTIEQLTAIPSIIGIKDASGDPDRPQATALAVGHRFLQFCGDDAGAVTFNLAGGRGCISVVANVAPVLCRTLQHACRVKDWAEARSIQGRLDPLIAALAREPNPGPIKLALSLLRPEFFAGASSASGGRRPGHGLGDRACTEGPRSRHAAGRPESGLNRAPRPLPD
jgi:4-hydroxy-tetrahydrodipicolinate synthase